MLEFIKNIFSAFKFTFIKDFFSFIKKSCDIHDTTSSTRITSYIILSMIVLFCFYFIGIGIYIFLFNSKTPIPSELLYIFTALLTHQLTLLGINKYHETKEKTNSKTPKITKNN